MTSRRWLIAAAVTVLAALVIGVPTGVIATPFNTRMTPVLNVPRARSLDEQARVQGVAENHTRETTRLAAVRRGDAERPDVVLWPENALDSDPIRDPALGSLSKPSWRAGSCMGDVICYELAHDGRVRDSVHARPPLNGGCRSWRAAPSPSASARGPRSY